MAIRNVSKGPVATPAKTTGGPPVETSSSETVQQILIDLGFSVGKAGADGIWGANSRAAMKKAAPAAGGIYLKSVRKAKSVVISPKGLTILLAGIRAIKKKKSVPSVASTIPGWIFTKSLQLTLKNLGYLSADQVDGKFGSITKAALEKAAREFGFTYSSSRPVFNLEGVVLNPLSVYLQLVDASAKGKTAPKPAAPKPKPAVKVAKPSVPLKKVKVLNLQKVLNKLGAKLKKDGLYGPKTARAYSKIAKSRKLNSSIRRVSGKVAKIASDSWMKLKAAAKPTVKLPKPEGAEWRGLVPGSTVEKPVIELQRILRKLGWRARTIALDKKYGPKTAGAWEQSSKTRNLDGRSWKVTLYKARVIAKTYDALKKEVSKPKKPTPAPKEKPKKAGLPGRGYASRDVQVLLIELKALPKGADDNIWGPKSRGGLKAAAISHGFRYISSTGYSGKKMVRVNPGDLIPKLQGVLTALRKKEAVDAAKEAKAEAQAKKAAAAEAEKRRREEAARAEAARLKREAAEKKAKRQKRKAKKKAKEARLAAEKAAQTKKEADRREAERKQKEAAAAQKRSEEEIARAKEEQRKAAAQEAKADSASKQADTAKQDYRDAAQDAADTTGQAREAYQEAKQQEATEEVEKAKPIKAAVGIPPMMFAIGGVLALGLAMMMGKKGGGPPAEWFEEE